MIDKNIGSFDFRVWDPKDESVVSGFLEVLNSAFGKPKVSNKEVFLWKHKYNPFGPSIVVYAVEKDSNKVVSIRPFWAWSLVYNGKSYSAYQPCDTATMKEFRGLGLFQYSTKIAMMIAKEKGGNIFFNFPNSNSSAGYLKLGWKDKGNVVVLVKPLHSLKIAFTIFASTKTRRSTMITNLRSGINIVSSNYNLLDAVDMLLKERGSWKDLIFGYRDRSIIEWRVFRHPLVEYQIIHNDDALAFIALGMRGALTEARILELLISKKYIKKNKIIANLIKQIKDKYNVDFVSIIISKSHPHYENLKAIGFHRVISHINFYAHMCSGCNEEIGKAPWALIGFDIDTQ